MKDSEMTFLEKLEREFEDIEKGSLSPNLKYREIESWSSMHALIIIAFLETEYNVSVTGDELRKCQTFNDLYLLASTKSN